MSGIKENKSKGIIFIYILIIFTWSFTNCVGFRTYWF